MIPKTIHYIWLGNKQLNNTSKICINSCRRNCPDYKIKIWNEKNLKLDEIVKKNKFLRKCLEVGLWAFASDYLRLYVLYKEGGIYLDTDVEVLKNFDELLSNEFFVGMESNDYIGTGVIGSEAHSIALKRILEFYDNEIWNVDYYNNPIIFKELMLNEKKYFDNCKIYPIDYFSPYNPQNYKESLIDTSNTICIHWYNASWGMTRKGYVFLQTKHFKNPVVKFYQILRKNIGYYRKKKTLNI